MNRNYNAYQNYVLQHSESDWDYEVKSARQDLLCDMMLSPDYHSETLRNGEPQPFLLTRGGEKHTYNVICRPCDELFAGDIIDAFGHKWLVMEARADATTHKTGIIQQCNQLFRFQNFTSEIIERYGVVDISGYSSSFNRDTQMQHSSEQVAIYLPYDEETAKIFVDKRLPSHIGFDKFDERILFSFKVTGTDPVSMSCNDGDHLLMIKAERFLYASDKDNLELGICDYIAPSDNTSQPDTSNNIVCEISGGQTLRIGGTRNYKVSFRYGDNTIVDTPQYVWTVDGNGVSFTEYQDGIKVSVSDDPSLIGSDIIIRVSSPNNVFAASEFRVEVTGIV